MHKDSTPFCFMFILWKLLYIYFLSQAYPTRAKGSDRGAPFSRPLAPFSVGCGGASVTWAQVGDSVARGASVARWHVGEM
jgi:hypothetical protein